MDENGSETTLKENREIILFGILTSLIVLFAGIISGIVYLIIISVLVFLGFAFLLGWLIYLLLLEYARKDLSKSVHFEEKPDKRITTEFITEKFGEERLREKVRELNFLLNSSKNRD